MEYAHKTSNLVVGKWYLVAHAEIKNSITGQIWDWIPVIPIIHKDAFAPHVDDHYHIDMRFNTNWAIKNKFNIKTNQTAVPILINDAYQFKAHRIIYKRKKCISLQTGLYLDNVHPEHDFFKWAESMKGKSCKGRKCPHFGAVMNEINGLLVCPMHGLIGDIKTEIIINQ
jgi:hypothetical protein